MIQVKLKTGETVDLLRIAADVPVATIEDMTKNKPDEHVMALFENSIKTIKWGDIDAKALAKKIKQGN